MIELRSVEEEELEAIKSHFDRLEELYLSPKTVSSLIIFSYIYLNHYRKEDFADFENFIGIYSLR